MAIHLHELVPVINNWYICVQLEIDRPHAVMSSLSSVEKILLFPILKGYCPKKPPHPISSKEVSVEKQRYAELGRWITAVPVEPPRGQQETSAA
jgi:hypothetical protein